MEALRSRYWVDPGVHIHVAHDHLPRYGDEHEDEHEEKHEKKKKIKSTAVLETSQ